MWDILHWARSTTKSVGDPEQKRQMFLNIFQINSDRACLPITETLCSSAQFRLATLKCLLQLSALTGRLAESLLYESVWLELCLNIILIIANVWKVWYELDEMYTNIKQDTVCLDDSKPRFARIELINGYVCILHHIVKSIPLLELVLVETIKINRNGKNKQVIRLRVLPKMLFF